MKRSRLKNKANKTGSKEDLKFYIIQRDVLNFKHFGIYWNPYFTNKDTLHFFYKQFVYKQVYPIL